MQDRDSREIVKALEEQLRRLSVALGVERLSLEQAINIYTHVAKENPLIGALARDKTKGLLAELIKQEGIDFDKLHSDPDKIHTSDQFERLLQTSDDLSPKQLQTIVDGINNAVPGTRKDILDSASRIPADPGGRERSFTLQERRKIFGEIEKYRSSMKLNKIFSKLAQRYDCSASTIKRIYYEDKPTLLTGEEDNDDN